MVSHLVAEVVPGNPTSTMKLLWLVPLLPLVGAAINLFLGKRLGRFAGWLAVATVVGSFVIAALVVRDLLSLPEASRLHVVHLFDWIAVGSFNVAVDLRLDALSATMILVVTGIGALIHIYAIGYMHGDPRYGRFFAYMNLFVFFMLMLVLGANFLVLYLGWEGVGLCSYLLIGFWFEKTENANAAKKAFITTRIGDTAMLIGIAMIVFKFGTLDFGVVFGTAGSTLTKGTATAIALLLFAGAVGKSAQVPLHVWLPDAMAGPTPVSALIHAATMVTAGVYLVLRAHVLFELSGVALVVVTVVGLVTMLFAATCALGQDDLKRVLAYSTVSQLGYMFIAAGMRAYGVALFMLVAHAFYKGLMFLAAGSVMHGMDDETDMKEMGGLIRPMPITGVTFLIGAISLAAVPPFAGFFAKDAILEVANHTGHQWVYVLGSIGAVLSAAYMGRMAFLTLFGKPRTEEAEHAHESPWVMTLPLVALAIGAFGLGLALQRAADGSFSRWIEPLLGAVPEGTLGLSGSTLVVVAVIIAVGTLAATWWIYASGRVDWMALRVRLSPLHDVLEHGWYVDDVYSTVLVAPGKAASSLTAYSFDLRALDGFVNAIGGGTRRLARVGRRIQTGYVRTYALAVFLGAVGLLLYVGFRS
jgi:NADH-quinone oxidoreductase subunit L